MSASVLLCLSAVALSSLVHSAHDGRGQTRGVSHHGPCTEILERLSRNETVPGSDFTADTPPECDHHGNFMPKQCHVLTVEEVGEIWCVGNQQAGGCFQTNNGRTYQVAPGEKWCLCVDPLTGQVNQSTARPASEELFCEGLHYGPCDEMVWKMQNNMPVEHEDFIDGQIPMCDDHGNFHYKQCHTFKENDTWCEDGQTGDDCYHFDEGETWCICVDPLTGHVDSHTATPGDLELHCGQCHEMMAMIDHHGPMAYGDYTADMIPECDNFGNFKPKQCHEFNEGDKWCEDDDHPDYCYHFDDGEGWCICVDPLSGLMDKDSPAPAEEELHCRKHSGLCLKVLWMIQNNKTTKHGDFRDDFVPECDDHGNLKPKQCHVFLKDDKWCEGPGHCQYFKKGQEWCICIDPDSGMPDTATFTLAGDDLHCGPKPTPCHDWLWMIENNKTKKHGDFRDDFVPECDVHGLFRPKQCHVFKSGDKWCNMHGHCHYFKDGDEWCVCMDPHTGETFDNTETENGAELHCGPPSGPCTDALYLIKHNKKEKHGDFRDDFVPECDEHGNFKPKQCHVFKKDDKVCDMKGYCHHFDKEAKWCICMDPHTGETDGDTFAPATEELHCGGEEPKCPKGWTYFTEHDHEHCFMFINSSKTWVDAERYCQFEGGHLASIHCEETEHFLQLLTKGKTHTFTVTWVGATNAVEPCFWVWLDGEFFNYENWEKKDTFLRPDSCLQINHSCGARFKWKSACCDETHPFVCAVEPGHHKAMDHY